MKQKVLYVFSGELASGAEIVIESLMFKNMKHVEPYLFISPGRFADKLIEQNKPYNITIVEQLRKLNRSKKSKLVFYFQALLNYIIISAKALRYILKNKIYIVHANTNVPATYLLPAALITKIVRPKTKWIWSDHDLKDFKIDYFFSNLCYKVFDKTLVVSNAVKAKYGNRTKIAVLYNGLDTEVFMPNEMARLVWRNHWGIEDDTIVFAIAGVITPRKRQLELINAFSKVQVNKTNIKLIIAGAFGPDDQLYNEKVREVLKSQKNIQYIGHVDNMVQFYNGCDVVVNNSSANGSEPFGATIYEAMSCETLVMAANTGGLPEIVDHNINGFLFAPDNEEALMETLEYIIMHYNRLEHLKKEGRKKVIQKFNFENIIHQYNQLLAINTIKVQEPSPVLHH